MDFIIDEYFSWLCTFISNKKYKNRNKLLSHLHNIEYTYFVDFDKNRALDGIGMRRYFSDETGYEDILYWNRKCSVLEMLVGLSVQMQNMTEDDTDDYNASKWFWELLRNIQLAYMTNSKYDSWEIDDIINKFMKRKYDRNGENYNIFTFEDCNNDIAKVELWYQMCWYIEDVYN